MYCFSDLIFQNGQHLRVFWGFFLCSFVFNSLGEINKWPSFTKSLGTLFLTFQLLEFFDYLMKTHNLESPPRIKIGDHLSTSQGSTVLFVPFHGQDHLACCDSRPLFSKWQRRTNKVSSFFVQNVITTLSFSTAL